MKAKLLLFLLTICAATGLFAQRGPQELASVREYSVTTIPGVVAAGAKWNLAWQGTDNADGIVGTRDGGLLFAQEQPNRIRKIDKQIGNQNDKTSVFLEDTHGTGAMSVDKKGRIWAVQRTCTDPGKQPDQCKEPTAVAILYPERKKVADNFQGKSLGRLNDLIVDKKGGAYFNGAGTYYVNAKGEVSSIGENIRTNGITLSREQKTLYVTNGGMIVAFDVQPEGLVRNQRDFAKLEGGGTGDGMAIDAEGRIYVTSQPGVQVLSPQGNYLGLIPTPRPSISAAFSGPGKRTLYIVGAGALGPDGKEFQTPPGVRNNAKTIYKMQLLSQGFKGRVK